MSGQRKQFRFMSFPFWLEGWGRQSGFNDSPGH